MDLLNVETIANLTAAALIVVALYIMYLNNKAQNSAVSAMSDATVKAVSTAFSASLDTMRQSNNDQRALHKKEMAELREEMARDRKEHEEKIAAERKESHEEVSALKKRVGDLESKVQERDTKIQKQESRIKSLEAENAQLKSEVERLKGQLNGKQDKEKSDEKKT